MSTYAYLACPESQESLWLGKLLRREGTDGSLIPFGFHVGHGPNPPNHENELLNKALWKFLAEHVGKELVILTDQPSEAIDFADFEEVTSRQTLEAYVGNWPSE